MNQKQQIHNMHTVSYNGFFTSIPKHVQNTTKRETQYKLEQRIPEFHITLLSMYSMLSIVEVSIEFKFAEFSSFVQKGK
jgi:hypothetical protein